MNKGLISKLVGFVVMSYGIFIVFTNWEDSKLFAILFISSGLFSLVTDMVFNPNDSNDERIISIKKQSGYIAYLLTVTLIVVTFLFYDFSIINNPDTALLIILSGSILLMPILMIFFSKKI